MSKHIWINYEKALELLLENGWLVPYPKKELGPAMALIPSMVVVQANKSKVWHVYGKC